MLVVCGQTLWQIVQGARCDDSPQTSLSACRGGVPPPPPTSVTGPPAARASDGAGAVVLPLTAATTVARAKAVTAPPRATKAVRRRRRLFFSELNDAPSAGDGCVFEVRAHDSATSRRRRPCRRWRGSVARTCPLTHFSRRRFVYAVVDDTPSPTFPLGAAGDLLEVDLAKPTPKD